MALYLIQQLCSAWPDKLSTSSDHLEIIWTFHRFLSVDAAAPVHVWTGVGFIPLAQFWFLRCFTLTFTCWLDFSIQKYSVVFLNTAAKETIFIYLSLSGPRKIKWFVLCDLLVLTDIKMCCLVFIRGWAVSTAISACGWIVTLAAVIAGHDPSAPRMAALSSLETKTSPWTPLKCGLWENPQSPRRSEYLFKFFYKLGKIKTRADLESEGSHWVLVGVPGANNVWLSEHKQPNNISVKPKKYMFAFCVIWALTKVSL